MPRRGRRGAPCRACQVPLVTRADQHAATVVARLALAQRPTRSSDMDLRAARLRAVEAYHEAARAFVLACAAGASDATRAALYLDAEQARPSSPIADA